MRRIRRSQRGFLKALDPRPTERASAVPPASAPDDDFFEPVNSIGAFAEGENWAQSWTYVGDGGSEYPGLEVLQTSPHPSSRIAEETQ